MSEAGPSSEITPVFKKRSRPTGGRSAAPARLLADEEPIGESSTEGAQPAEEELSVADLLALRSLARKPTGIALEKLNAGEKKAKAKAAKASGAKLTEDEKWAEQMRNGGLVSKEGGAAENDGEEAAPRLVKTNNFQGETGTIDVDAHMLAYVESEMAARRAAAGAASSSEAAAPTVSDLMRASGNPEDELYRIAERYREIQENAKAKEKKKENEGGVSAAMLTGVMEVDLGMETKLRNIAETEAAKRAMEAAKNNRQVVNEEDQLLATARFFQTKSSVQSDADAVRTASEANKDAEEAAVTLMGNRSRGAFTFPEGHAFAGEILPGSSTEEIKRNNKREEKATDDAVMERFKKRQRNQLKR